MKVNVPQLIIDLENAGLSDAEIAIRSDVRKSGISLWRAGDRRPSFDAGLRLLAVHQQFCAASSPLKTLFGLQPRVEASKPIGGRDDGEAENESPAGRP